MPGEDLHLLDARADVGSEEVGPTDDVDPDLVPVEQLPFGRKERQAISDSVISCQRTPGNDAPFGSELAQPTAGKVHERVDLIARAREVFDREGIDRDAGNVEPHAELEDLLESGRPDGRRRAAGMSFPSSCARKCAAGPRRSRSLVDVPSSDCRSPRDGRQRRAGLGVWQSVCCRP